MNDVTDPEQMLTDAFNEHRPLLFSIAYRMLGSATDAEDMLQETWLRWRQTAGDAIRSPRAMLVTIISRLCINQLQSARVRREEYVGQWLPEPLVTAPANDPLALRELDESLSMAFLVLLERLNPVERATLLLRDVFDYDYADIAAILGRNEATCRQILSRARQHITEDRPRFSASAEEKEHLMRQFLGATAGGDLDGLVALLSNEVVLYADGGGKAAAVPNLIHGPHDVATLLIAARRKYVPADEIRKVVEINGQPGVVGYSEGRARAVLTFDVADGRIARIFIVTNPEKLANLPGLEPVN